MTKQGFNLTANLTINTLNLAQSVTKIQDALNKVTGNIYLNIDPDGKLKKLQTSISNIQSKSAAINITVKGATAKQIDNISKLARTLERHRDSIKSIKRSIDITVKTPSKTAIQKITDLGVALKQVSPTLSAFASKDINVRVRAPSQRAIQNINDATVALQRIQPLLASMGGGANIGINITGLGAKRLTNFASGLGNVSTQLKTTLPDLHKLNTALGQKITHLQQFQQAAAAAGKSIAGLGTNVKSIKGGINQTSSSVRNLATHTQQATSFMYDFGKSGGLAVKRFGAFTIATTVVFGFINAIGQAFREGVEFEKQLAKIAQVSNTSILGVKNLGDEVGRLAVQYGIASGQLLKINQIFAQAGLRGYELQQALNAIAKSDLAPTFTDMENTSEGLIAMMGQFNIQANDFEKALGSINAVSAEFAVESDDLISAIRIFGGVFAKASNETKPGLRQLQELLAIFTGIRDTTRESAESIATGLRTITTRLQRPRTANLLESYGINVRDVEGNFIGMYEAVEELNKKLKTMNKLSEGYAKISEEIGGYRQKGKTIPLTEQIDKMQKALNVARQGEGSLTDQMDTQLQTLSRRAIMVAEDFKKMIREIMNTESFKRIVDVVLNAAEAFVRLADAIKPILPLLSVLAVVRGGLGAAQFAKGAIDQLKHNQTSVVGNGIRAVQAGGISGFGGVGGAISGYFGGIRQNFQQAGFFQQTPTILTRRQIRDLSLQGTQQFTGMIPNAGPGTAQFFHPKVSNILTPVIKNLATTYGVGSRNFRTAIDAVVRELYRNRDAIRRGAYSPGTAVLTAGGRRFVAQDNVWWRRAGRGMGVAGRALADRSGSLLMGGMMLSAAGGGHPATNIIGKTLSGAGIGGMMGGPWGVAIGAVTGGVMGIVQAMGPEKIQRANDALAKALEGVSKKFDDFGRYDLKNVNDDLGSVVKDLEKAMFDAFNVDIKFKSSNKQSGSYSNIADISSPPMSKEEIDEAGRIRASIITKGFRKASQEELNRAGEVYQKFAPKAKEAFGYLGQIIKEEGSLFKNGELDVEKVKGIESKYGKGPGFIESLLNISSLGGKDSNLAAQNIAKILFEGADAEKARKVMEAIWQARNNELLVIRESEKKVEDLVFTFDKMRLSLEQLDSMVSRVAEKNKLLASTTDQYFDNAISGPASNKIIFTKPQNPFNNTEGLDPSELRRQYKDLGITSTSQIGNTLYFGDLLNQKLPQLVEQANKSFMPKKNEFLLKELFGGTKDNSVGGLIGGMDKEIREKLREVIKDAGTGEGTIKIDDLSKEFKQILKPVYEQTAQIASKQFEMISEQTQRIVDIIGKRLELEQRLRNDELNLIQQRQGFSEQRANLFYEEDPFQKGQRLAANRAEVMAKLSSGKNFTQLFAEREQLRADLNNKDIVGDEAKRKGLEVALLENQNEINKLTESLQKATDVNDQLANIQQQSLKFQQKREAGRTLVGRIQSMSGTEKAEYMRGLGLAIQMRKEGKLPDNITKKDFNRLDNAISLVSEFEGDLSLGGKKAIDEMKAIRTREWTRLSDVKQLGEFSGFLAAGGTQRENMPEEKALLGAFDTLAKSASIAASELIKMVEEDKKRALEKFEFEKQEAKKGINSTIIRANQAFIVRDSGKAEDVEEVPLESKAKGGKLGGSGPIPILAHGGELIVPKNKVNQGLAGVVDFAKSQGLVFESGGKVPTLDELKKGAIDKLTQFPIEEYKEIYPEMEKQLSNVLSGIQQSKNKVDLQQILRSYGGLGNEGIEVPLGDLLSEIQIDNSKDMLSWRKKPESAYESAKRQQRMAYDSRRKEYLEKRYGKKLTDEDKEKRRQQINEIASKRAIPIKKKQSILDRFKKGVAGEQTSFSAKEALNSDTTLDFIETPLGDVLKFIEDSYGVKINASYGYTGFGSDTPVTTNLKGVSLNSGLGMILNKFGLKHEIRNNEIFIDTPENLENERKIQEVINTSPTSLREYKRGETFISQDSINIRARSIARNAAIDAGSRKTGVDANFGSIIDATKDRPEMTNYPQNVLARKLAMQQQEQKLSEAKKGSESMIDAATQLRKQKEIGAIAKSIIMSGDMQPEDFDNLYKLMTVKIESPEHQNLVSRRILEIINKYSDFFTKGEQKTQEEINQQKLLDAYYGGGTKYLDQSQKRFAPVSKKPVEEKKDLSFEEIRRRAREKNRKIDEQRAAAAGYNEFNAPLKTYRPEEYNKRYGKGFAVGYEENRGDIKAQFQETNAVKAKRAAEEADLKRFGEAQAKSKSFIEEGSKLSYIREQAQRARNALAFRWEMDNNTRVKLGELISGTKGEDINQWMARANTIESLLANTNKPGTYDVAGKLDLWRQSTKEVDPDYEDLKKRTNQYLKDIPGFAGGTPEVTRTGQALIHKGEAILPASEITAFANAIRMATESIKGFGAGKNVGGIGENGRSAVDEALIKAANTLSQINIPEKIVLEFPSAIQHQVTFNNGDILSEKVSNLIAEKVNQMIQRQISSVISPVDGSTLVG